jgi:hypothetical protein
MKKDELKLIISISVALSAIFAFVYIIFNGSVFEVSSIFRALSSGLSLTTLFWVFYFSYGWKIPIFKEVFYRPDLNGTWCGTLESDWKNAEGNPIEPKKFHIVIRQNFLQIHFTTFTDGFVGVSYSETFTLNKDKGIKNIAYLFRKDTTQDHDDSVQEGATELKLIEGGDMILQGKYWSSRKTNGKIDVIFVSRKHVDSFEEGRKLIK